MIEKNTIYNMDCEEGMRGIPSNSVDIISTDPPYVTDQWKEAYEKLAYGAMDILKPGGWLIFYLGHYHMDEIMNIFESVGFSYYWIICQLNQGPTAMVYARKVICGWKPILVYAKPPMGVCEKGFIDVIKSDKEKNLHPWQQSLEDQLWILSRFTKPGQTLVEPFCGSGTAVSAAKRLGLDWYAFENDEATYKVAKARQIQESILDEW